MFPGFGTVVNMATVVIGSSLGLLLGHRLPKRTRDTVTDALGLVTLLIGGLAAVQVTSAALSDLVGSSAPVLIVLGAMLFGGIVGSLLDIEARLEGFGGWLRTRLGTGGREDGPLVDGEPAKERFVEGFVTASLVFCVGPLTILGSLSDGLGLGADQLILKSGLDGFASIAFAASLGAGVMASVVSLGVIQGLLTLLGFLLGDFVPAAHLAALTATGGLLLLGVGLRLLHVRQVPVGNLLPALVVAPLLVQLVAVLGG
ncbi:DUF554 domain-containing protein [Microlunatus panaciterrae]|uniref:Membrane protein YqgA involved in biofilm formation n=1 Tax=Microlunatus panaciterrae TaxID=400768 RepID=A0ABS2RE88_9ACTN|nr:DUF554 domain-containing protein [Microlunatus panaciterrae]MBM7797306.1 putative membrane protein YqgA involved in biofilm formation [Microlunatus panaciterrae]